MTERLTVDGLVFEVRRAPRRRTIGLTIERDGTLRVSAPVDCEESALHEALRSKLLWVHTKLAARRLLQGTAPRHRYVGGEGFWYLGDSYRLRVLRQAESPLRWQGGWFELSESARVEARSQFIRWYAARLEEHTALRAARFAGRLGVTPTSVRVDDLGTRWGCCDPYGTVRLHWRLAMLPPSAIDYVLAHELAHLRSARHDRAFWDSVDRVLPDWEVRRRWLAENGARYDL